MIHARKEGLYVAEEKGVEPRLGDQRGGTQRRQWKGRRKAFPTLGIAHAWAQKEKCAGHQQRLWVVRAERERGGG